MRKNFFAILMLCLISIFANAQDQYVTGLIIDEQADAAYLSTGTISSDFGNKNGELPFKASLKEFCPPIQNQGRIGSCVGWASGYSAMTIINAKKYGWSQAEIADKAFSALFVYNHVKVSDCPFGSHIDDAIKILKVKGNISSREFDMPREDCGKLPTTAQLAVAENFKVKDYATLFELNADAKTKIYNTKKSIHEGVPVIIGMQILRNFGSLNKDTPYWNPAVGNTAPWGGHAMSVIGYDESRQAFEIMNSWGTQWGVDGFIWVKYDDFARFCKYGYQIFLDEGKEEPKPDNPIKPTTTEVVLTGAFNYRFPIFDENGGDIQFDVAEVSKKGDYTYEMKRKDWQEGQMFQLEAKNLKKGSYVYVFSIDPNKKTMIHWPRNKGLDSKFSVDGLTEKPLVPYSGQTIIVPGEASALVKEVAGTDYVFILYSNEPIDNIKEVVEKLKYSDDFESTLEDELGDKLIPTANIEYRDGQMKFSAKSKKGYIVPIILEQEGN
jgi:hypothetical protein